MGPVLIVGTFDRQIETVRKAIEKYGQKCVWNQPAHTESADPWKHVDAPPASYDCTIIFLPENMQLADFIAAVGGTEVKSGRLKGLMVGDVEWTPDPQDTVKRGVLPNSPVLQIDSIEQLAPNGQVIFYTIFFKG